MNEYSDKIEELAAILTTEVVYCCPLFCVYAAVARCE